MRRPTLCSLTVTAVLCLALALPASAGGWRRGGGEKAPAAAQQRLRDRNCIQGAERRLRAENRVGSQSNGDRKRLRDGSCLEAPAASK